MIDEMAIQTRIKKPSFNEVGKSAIMSKILYEYFSLYHRPIVFDFGILYNEYLCGVRYVKYYYLNFM